MPRPQKTRMRSAVSASARASGVPTCMKRPSSRSPWRRPASCASSKRRLREKTSGGLRRAPASGSPRTIGKGTTSLRVARSAAHPAAGEIPAIAPADRGDRGRDHQQDIHARGIIAPAMRTRFERGPIEPDRIGIEAEERAIPAWQRLFHPPPESSRPARSSEMRISAWRDARNALELVCQIMHVDDHVSMLRLRSGRDCGRAGSCHRLSPMASGGHPSAGASACRGPPPAASRG